MPSTETVPPTRWRSAVSRLDARLDGGACCAGDPGYAAVRDVFNTDVDHAPAALVTARGPSDVVAAVRLATAFSRPVAVQATGHGSPRVGEDAVLVSTRAMRGIRIDPVTRTATIGAGVRSGALVRAAADVGLAPLNGASPLVGTVGYTLGGGIGPLGRAYGFAADHVRELEVVTPGGLLTASPDREPELFWASRGGKGNFGVVTRMTVDLFPVERMFGGGLFFSADDAGAVVPAYAGWTAAVPDRMTSSLALLRLPDLDGVPEPLRGRFVVHVRIAFAGPAADGERWSAALRSVAKPLLDTVGPMAYSDVASIHADPTDPGPYHDRSGLLSRVDQPAVEALLEVAGPDSRSPVDVVELRHLGGAFGRSPEHGNAVGYRDAAFTLFTVAVAGPDRVDAVRSHQDGLLAAMAPWRIGGACLSYMGSDEGAEEHVRAAYEPATHRRLREIKATYDPGNVFRMNHNIPPATTPRPAAPAPRAAGTTCG